MDKEKVYNEAVGGDEGFAAGDGYPSCDGEPCANVTDESSADADTMAGDRNTPKAASEELPSRDWEAEIAEWQDKYEGYQVQDWDFTCVCRPSSTISASARCGRRWSWCRAEAPSA